MRPSTGQYLSDQFSSVSSLSLTPYFSYIVSHAQDRGAGLLLREGCEPDNFKGRSSSYSWILLLLISLPLCAYSPLPQKLRGLW